MGVVMSSKVLCIGGVIFLAILAVGGIGWLVVNLSNKEGGGDTTTQNENKDRTPPEDSAAGPGVTKPSSGPKGDPAPPSPLATPTEARESLDGSIKSIKLHRVWDSTYHAVGDYKPRTDNAD